MIDPEELTERLEWAEVPKRYRECRFSTFDAYTAKLARKLTVLEQLSTERRGMFIFGPVGSGKTHLAVAALAAYTLIGAHCKFLGAADFVNSVQLAYGNPKEIVAELVREYNCILIDDLGAQRANEASRSALMYLVGQIYDARKKVIVTSNLVPKDIYAFEPRIMSRLTEVCALVELDASDYRIRTAQHRQKLVQSSNAVAETVN
jgi:DNA replication protein DnaC